ncbi:MAG: redox-sensing transcriptional repressor Rex [Firmicutes bacterium]|nr:redox-sensing transcriptional repressor Rex [Bacillota bacterium]
MIKISETTVIRLTTYLKYLRQLEEKGIELLSSKDIAEGVGIPAHNVRKDLAFFGEFGTRGVGYNTKSLISSISKILGVNKKWNVVLVGAGKVGAALVTYDIFKKRGFNIVAVFDSDTTKIGKTIGDMTIMPLEEIPGIVSKYDVKIGIMAVPLTHAQGIANLFIENNIEGILNFAPTFLKVPKSIYVQNADFTALLESITFKHTNREMLNFKFI